MKKAIISGISGMDASHLAELLLSKGYHVTGFYRRSSQPKLNHIQHLLSNPNFQIEEGDLTDSHYIADLINRKKPDKFFNTAAQSHVGTSYKQPQLTFEVNTIGVLNILEAIKNYSKKTKLTQFCTSEMWGTNIDSDKRQRETTPFAPISPYAVAKLAAFELCKAYQFSYGIFARSSICHNHTGPRRGDNFFEKKVINWIAKNHERLERGEIFKSEDKLKLGNLDAYRDFSHSKDCVEAIYLMSEMEQPADYVVSSDFSYSMKEILNMIFDRYDVNCEDYIEYDYTLFRPSDVPYLRGDSTKIRTELGWKPKYHIEKILDEMLDEQIKIYSSSRH